MSKNTIKSLAPIVMPAFHETSSFVNKSGKTIPLNTGVGKVKIFLKEGTTEEQKALILSCIANGKVGINPTFRPSVYSTQAKTWVDGHGQTTVLTEFAQPITFMPSRDDEDDAPVKADTPSVDDLIAGVMDNG
jgi:hypothetical protein|tara:strand:+ start:2375 stop:2773 length:399 start_codon:yes stop_codon:yes gene_type:complete